jgi:hypothetical protein
VDVNAAWSQLSVRWMRSSGCIALLQLHDGACTIYLSYLSNGQSSMLKVGENRLCAGNRPREVRARTEPPLDSPIVEASGRRWPERVHQAPVAFCYRSELSWSRQRSASVNVLCKIAGFEGSTSKIYRGNRSALWPGVNYLLSRRDI